MAGKIIAHGFFRTISGAKQTKIKSLSHSPKNAPCEQNLKIPTNFTPKTQLQLEKNAVCKQALIHQVDVISIYSNFYFNNLTNFNIFFLFYFSHGYVTEILMLLVPGSGF